MNVEKITPIYSPFGANALQQTLNALPLFRAPFGHEGARYYFRKGFDEFYAGYSLWTSSVIPKSPHLIKWMVEEGDAGKQKAHEARVYGTILHHIIAECEREGGAVFKFDGPVSCWWKAVVRSYIEGEGLNLFLLYDAWCKQVQNDMYAWYTFKKDYEVNVIAVEFPIYDDDYLIATPADVIALMKVDGKEVSAAIDIKATTRPVANSFEYALQLYFIRHAFNKLFGHHFAIERIYNWSLMDRVKSPGKYRLEEQKFKASKGEDQELFYLLARLVKITGINQPGGKIIAFEDGEDGSLLMTTKTPKEWLYDWQNNKNV